MGDHEHLLRWVRETHTHPLTRAPMSPRDIVKDEDLQAKMRDWLCQFADEKAEDVRAGRDDDDGGKGTELLCEERDDGHIMGKDREPLLRGRSECPKSKWPTMGELVR